MSTEQMLDFPIPSDEETRKKFDEGMEQIKASILRKQAEDEYINESLDAMKELTGIPKKQLRKLGMDLAKGTFSKRSQEQEAYDELYNGYVTIFKKE